MTNRCNPQHGSNMVDRYIGSSFDVVYAVYKIVDQLPMIYKFAVEYLPELERLEREKVDKIEGMGLSSNDFTHAFVDQLLSLGTASLEDVEAFDANGSAAAALNEAKLYTNTEVASEALRTDLAITSARGYTDSKVADLTLHTEALHNSAKLYTDTHLATAKDYSDGILVQAKSYTDIRELALNALIQAQATTISNLSDANTALEQALQSLTARVTALEGTANP